MFAALILILAVTLYRVCYAFGGSPSGWANFSPLAAILLCSAAYLPRQFILLIGLGPLLAADLILNVHYQPAADRYRDVFPVFLFRLNSAPGIPGPETTFP